MPDDNHISTVRALMIEQLRALRTAAPGADLEVELKRAKGVSEVAQTIINSAKVEVDFLAATNQDESTFLKSAEEGKSVEKGTSLLPGPGNGITSITRHRM